MASIEIPKAFHESDAKIAILDLFHIPTFRHVSQFVEVIDSDKMRMKADTNKVLLEVG
jgi:hypothetical protein